MNVGPKGTSQVSRRSKVGNHKQRTLDTLLSSSSGTSAGTFACPAGPYINTVPKQARKTNLTCFLYQFKRRGRKSVLTALFIPLHKSWARGMGIGEWLTPCSENFEEMVRGLEIIIDLPVGFPITNIISQGTGDLKELWPRKKKKLDVVARERVCLREFWVPFWSFNFRKRGVLRDTTSMYLTILKYKSHWNPIPR